MHADAHRDVDPLGLAHGGHHLLHRKPHAHHTRRVVGTQVLKRSGAHNVGVADGLDLVDVVLLAEPIELLEDVRQDAQHLLRRVGGGEGGEADHVRLQHGALREDLDEVELVAADGPEDGLGQRVGGELVHARAHDLLQLHRLSEQRRVPVVVAHLRDLLVRAEHAEEVEERDLDQVAPEHAQRVGLLP